MDQKLWSSYGLILYSIIYTYKSGLSSYAYPILFVIKPIVKIKIIILKKKDYLQLYL